MSEHWHAGDLNEVTAFVGKSDGVIVLCFSWITELDWVGKHDWN